MSILHLSEKRHVFSIPRFELPILKAKTTQTVACFVVLAVVPYFVPGLERLRVLLPTKVARVINPQSTPLPATPAASEVLPSVADTHETPQENASETASSKVPPPTFQAKPGEIEDASGTALNYFFAALKRAETEGRQVRICHYGDSPITSDAITSTVRRKLQQRFGDAGHGFILADKPWGWYGHIGVTQRASAGWTSDPMFISRGDHRYGLGGVSFTTRLAGVTGEFGTASDAEVGHTVSSFDLYYLTQPGGGDFDVELDGKSVGRVSTKGEKVESGFHRVETTEGPHKLTVRTVGNGEVRFYGAVLESGAHGVQYDSLGLNGAFVGLLSRYMDGEHWTEQLRLRNPDLVVVNYGTNESEYDNWPMKQYEADMKEVVRRIRAALPEVSILFVSPMDRGKRGPEGDIITRPTIPRLVEAQRRFAAENGCAFFDMFTAMGGDGTVARWVAARPKLMGSDFTHPTWQGSEIVGTLLHDALMRAYDGKPNQ